ncbi:Protein timeless, partial [Stegodyphus mimosarum]
MTRHGVIFVQTHLTTLEEDLKQQHVSQGSRKATVSDSGMMISVPLVPYTEEQRLILRDEVFLQLLQKLGFHLGLGDNQMYPRIPLFWKADVLFAVAARLGPMKKDKLKFTYEELSLADPNHDLILRNSLCPPLPPLSSCCTLSTISDITGKGADLSDFDKGQIVMAGRVRTSVSKTACLVGCSRVVVVNTYRKWYKDGKTTSHQPAVCRRRHIYSRGERSLYALFAVTEKIQQPKSPPATTLAT